MSKLRRGLLSLIPAILFGVAGGAVMSHLHADADAAGQMILGGRAQMTICVSVDGGSSDLTRASKLVTDAVTALKDHSGWYGISQRPRVTAGCPFRAASLATNGTSPQRNGGTAKLSLVTNPSPYFLHVYITTPSEIRRVFGTLPDQVLTEEVTCLEPGVCAEVTKTLLLDDAALADPATLRQQLLHGLGLVPPTRGISVAR